MSCARCGSPFHDAAVDETSCPMRCSCNELRIALEIATGGGFNALARQSELLVDHVVRMYGIGEPLEWVTDYLQDYAKSIAKLRAENEEKQDTYIHPKVRALPDENACLPDLSVNRNDAHCMECASLREALAEARARGCCKDGCLGLASYCEKCARKGGFK